MAASDEYLAKQTKAMVSKNLSPAGADSTLAVDTVVALADAHVGQKEWDMAIQLYGYALFFEPTAADVLTLRGWAYLRASQETSVGASAEASAALDFNEALRFLPDSASALAGLKELKAK